MQVRPDGYEPAVDQHLASVRRDYGSRTFGPEEAGDDPMATFRRWLDAAIREGAGGDPTAMTLATASPAGLPTARMVLLKDLDPVAASFTWFTSLESRKAFDLLENPHAALCFWWPGTAARQVRVTGRVEEVDAATASAYFATRPREAQAAAAISHQSRGCVDRTALDARIQAALASSAPIDKPQTWGGYRLVAEEIEFWQGRNGRAHDRIAFLRLDERGDPYSARAVVAAGGSRALSTVAERIRDPHGQGWLRVRLEP